MGTALVTTRGAMHLIASVKADACTLMSSPSAQGGKGCTSVGLV
jgi:hypothetical protein